MHSARKRYIRSRASITTHSIASLLYVLFRRNHVTLGVRMMEDSDGAELWFDILIGDPAEGQSAEIHQWLEDNVDDEGRPSFSPPPSLASQETASICSSPTASGINYVSTRNLRII